MKRRMINEREDWTFWVPDNVADWDAPTNWERERLASMEELLRPGMVLYDIGAEHGWLSAVYGTFVGHENMVLAEPSLQFWPNIRKVWEYNGFPYPRACYAAFVADRRMFGGVAELWPAAADGPECDAQAYRHLNHRFLGVKVPIVTIDTMRPRPDAITIDVEGAELLVILGAQETLVAREPEYVWISVHPDMLRRDFDADSAILHRRMESFGYRGELLAIDHEEHWLYRRDDA